MTTSPVHADVNWYGFSLVEQLANAGSEVDRAIRAHQAGSRSRFENALGRALDLFEPVGRR